MGVNSRLKQQKKRLANRKISQWKISDDQKEKRRENTKKSLIIGEKE